MPSMKPDRCPGCGRPFTIDGQPSNRWFYSCGSYLYEGDEKLRYQTHLCGALEARYNEECERGHANDLLNQIQALCDGHGVGLRDDVRDVLKKR